MAYGPPPGSPPPPAYGTPAGGSSAFNPKSVNPLDWVILGGALLALIFSFFSFYEYKGKGSVYDEGCKHLSDVPAAQRGAAQDVCDGIGNSAWHGFFGWFGVLLLVVAAVLVALALFAPHVSLPVPARLAALAAAGLGLICVLLALFVVPDGDYNGQTIDSGASDTDAGHGFSYWIVLILAIIVTVACFLRFQQTGGQLPNRGASAGGATPPSGYGQQSAAGYPPPAQPLPPQTPQQGYAPPQTPPPGYAPPQAPQQQPGFQPPPPPQQPPGYGQQPPPGYTPPPPPA